MPSPMIALRNWLMQRPAWVSVAFAALVTFSVYTCMYGYRKAFTAAAFEGQTFMAVSYKVWLVIAQVIGYMLSKFAGIRFIAEATGAKRSQTIVRLIAISWAALFAFAIVPAPYNIIFLLANGFPLGLIWGLVFSYVEGRKATELMGAVLASSFIFASGFAKTMGSLLTQYWLVQELWMPFVAGAIYFIPLLLACWLLNAIPPPTTDDVAQRIERQPMNASQRKLFLLRFAPGLVMLIAAYILLTVLRDFRDNFANEILTDAGLSAHASVFAATETPVALLVLVSVSLLMLVRNNYKAFFLNHLLVITGLLLAAISTVLYGSGIMSAFYWFVCTGAGLYMGYIPINCLYFDRMIATFKVTANVGFVMYVADSFGYLGSVLVLFVKQFAGWQLSWSSFFMQFIYGASAIGIGCTLAAMWYYKKKYQQFVAYENK